MESRLSTSIVTRCFPSEGACIADRFGSRLRSLRQTHGYTQGEFARVSGIDRSFLSDVERGKTNISISYLAIIADGFSTSVSELLRSL